MQTDTMKSVHTPEDKHVADKQPQQDAHLAFVFMVWLMRGITFGCLVWVSLVLLANCAVAQEAQPTREAFLYEDNRNATQASGLPLEWHYEMLKHELRLNQDPSDPTCYAEPTRLETCIEGVQYEMERNSANRQNYDIAKMLLNNCLKQEQLRRERAPK